ncbi:hydrolase [Streptomyces sp. HUCO-GS316]|uniref:ricin-type beta-trefoil lectin domain protein n=1 Tax=Streptomyces sp. HUCO-GS316 TaxID=2692198 RepID=UPI00136BAF1C|nr:hydrolase [Streptomyces sp. HUCO-GS316]
MPTPHPPHPPYSPQGGVPGESDENLAARLRGRAEGEAAHSVALLMARHWQPVHAYAVVSLTAPASLASMVTAAAFHQVLARLALGEPALALRPRLLVAVRDTIAEWSARERTAEVLPGMGKPARGRGVRSAVSPTPENRRLAERSFQSLPGLARCLLWHTEVEAEPLAVPAALVGMQTDTASVTLEQAREKFREGCVHAHRELAPTKDCRFYNRLLDIPIRRGGALLPDVQQHLDKCPYCRYAAEQLSHFEGGLGELIAEAVLGESAAPYLDARRGRPQEGLRTRHSARHGHGRGRRRLAPRGPLPGRTIPPALRSSRALLTGAGLASAGLLATVLVAGLLSPGDGADPAVSTSTTGGSGSPLPPAVSSAPPGTAQLPTAPGRTRLRNAADLCLDIRGTVEAGAGTELAACSSAATQQWAYESDGLLRSAADPDLCLDSYRDAGVVVLGGCASPKSKRADQVRYDLTVQGELLPRWQEQLALASTTRSPGADIVVKVRDGSRDQRWLTDSVPASPRALSDEETDTPPARTIDLTERAGRT